MTSHRRAIRRSTLCLALAVCFAGGVQAQTNAAGALAGNATAGDTITVSNPATGFSRTITVGADGNYRFSSLPVGSYTVTRNGGSPRQVSVNVGTAANVDFGGEAATLDAVTVVGTGAVNPIDVSSVESATVLTEEVIDRLPVARDVASVAMLAPGTVRTDAFGVDAISFGGASAAENAYFINGFNVTNIRSGLAYNEVPFEGIAETQTKTGGYGAEFGRSLGGVTNVITKRGTNEWKFGVAATWEPDALRSPYLRSELINGRWELLDKEDTRNTLVYTVQAGGPIIKDRLFLYALYQGDKDEREVYGTTNASGGTVSGNTSNNEERSNDQGLIKLDWNINDDHLIELTAFRDRDEVVQTQYTLASPWGTDRLRRTGTTTFTTGGDSYIGRWTGYLTDTLTLSALYGKGEYINASTVPNTNCPYVLDNRTGTLHGCAVQASFGRGDNGDTRTAWRLDGEWAFGAHTLRFGLDHEKIHSIGATISSGGVRYDVFDIDDVDLPEDIEANVPAGTETIVTARQFSNGGEFDTENTAWYIEDRWQVTENFLAYFGFRSESFENFNAAGVTFAKSSNTRAPRLGFAWDMNGDSTRKLFGNAGRYYIPIMTNTNVRMSGAELDITTYYTSNGTFGGGQFDLPNLGTNLGAVVQSDGVANDPRSVVDPNLSPMYQDEYILGFQQQLSDKWSGGIRAIYRKLGSGMDDYCAYQRPLDWALANGYSEDEAERIATATSACFLMNPGRDLTMNVDLDGDGPGGLTQLVIPNSVLGLPEPTRTYKAVEVFFERAWDERWTLQGSYTYAKSFGNSEGYVNSAIVQQDAGITADFDFAEFTEHATGYLPNDRRHALKLFGAYAINDEWRIGSNILIQSGRPRSCSGSYAGNITPEDPTLYAGTSWYCNGQPSPRGTWGRTPWTRTVGMGLSYTPMWMKGLRLGVDVFNLLNEQGVTATRQIEGARFQKPIAWQQQRYFRFNVSYDF
jgi:hypothetical protein